MQHADIIRELEGMIGSEGSTELATSLLDVLVERGYAPRTADGGYELAVPDWNDQGDGWNRLLIEAESRLQEDAQ